MIINFTFSNHRSFRVQEELSFVASASLKDPGFGSHTSAPSKFNLLNVAGLFGANASGKSNVLDAVWAFRTAVTNSQTQWKPDGPIPRNHFRLDGTSGDSPSLYQVDLILDGTPLQYGFSLSFETVLEEWLYAWPEGRRQMWLNREGPQQFKFGRMLKGPNKLIAKLTRPNSLFLSTAAQSNHDQLTALYHYIDQKILLARTEDEPDRAAYTMSVIRRSEKDANAVGDLMREADLGVVGFTLDKKKVELPKALHELLQAATDKDADAPPNRLLVDRLRIAHAAKHEADGIKFDLKDESDGTLRWFALIGPMLRALEDGALLLIDELNASLHELLQAELVRRFNNPECNPHGAQLLFNSQDSTLLGDLLGDPPPLRRDQVWFVEKSADGASSLTPLTDFRVRAGENIQRRYLQGRFRAVPYIEGLKCVRQFRDDSSALLTSPNEAPGG